MLKTYITTAFCLLTLALQAQQEHHYTQFMYNKLLINPAYAGSRGVPTTSAIYRNQWYSFDGAPKSVLASIHSPFLSKRVGIGGVVSHNTIGLHSDLQVSLSYSYSLIKKEDFSLQVGLSGAVRSLNIALDKADPFSPIDPSLDNQRIKHTFGTFGAGIYGKWKDQLYFGVSVPHINKTQIGINTTQGIETAELVPHFYAMAGGVIPVSDHLNIMPAVLFKYVQDAPFDADINLNLEIYEKVTTGVSYRLGGDGPGESLDVLLYWQFHPQIAVGAAYDITLSHLNDYAGGSFELLLQADLKKLNKNNMSNPRFFL